MFISLPMFVILLVLWDLRNTHSDYKKDLAASREKCYITRPRTPEEQKLHQAWLANFDVWQAKQIAKEKQKSKEYYQRKLQ